MKYVSTRGEAPKLNFEEVLLTGLARDGGLYLPETWPTFSVGEISAMRGMSYQEIAFKVMSPYVCPEIPEDDFKGLIKKAYSTFRHDAVVPLSQLDNNEWILELYHGPTLAFKDVALQLLGHLFDYVLTKNSDKITIVGATSGDTGSAAIDCVQGRACAEIFMLHPKGRVSDVQRKQMTSVIEDNVHNIAIEGDFDNCQALVKALFNDLEFRDKINLSAVNSINWARVMAQIVYYFTSAVALGAPDRKISFSVPTGNFGDVYAGYIAKQMGLPIEQLVVATNVNDILSRTINGGEYKVGETIPTISPSMDIQVSSNFERLLYNIYDGSGADIRNLMENLNQGGLFTIADAPLEKAKGTFDAIRVSEDETKQTIADVYNQSGHVVDPHTAVGVYAARHERNDQATPMVSLSTAHPAKFPEAVKEMTGAHPELPPHMADLFEREEKFDVLPNDLETLKKYILENL
ncbi:MAG: threonine synthase [Emcibacteraceae bacterium]|nr:threonine synthase [Emcibacteraceae bacterium]MDG1995080.1 threonine synthase [Emcibacteraceae bacterium]